MKLKMETKPERPIEGFKGRRERKKSLQRIYKKEGVAKEERAK